ncbi:MAG TPA: transglycosylase SLT domain-containing protein [Steroidobacteraceae bacterium]|nr:transglycosylase SLT domain-containing protein [Steroidobacteraceae bacterium]
MRRPRWASRALTLGLALIACALLPVLARADDPVPLPQALEPDVEFWIRVYTQIDTNAGFLHDQYNLKVIYDTLHFAPDASQREREREVDEARDRYAAALRRIAAGESPLSADDERVKGLWGDATPARLREAVDDIRFQLGQSDRFRAGLIRSGAWEAHIEATLEKRGLPSELAVLPHVESSFNPEAHSKVGAAGLWQFMRSTGRRYLRIDRSVDDRLDPFRSTEAAAQLLAYNYRVLGTWPLALTAWNHGTAGVRRAKEQLGTDDIATIVRRYTSRTFGFASRNFYVSFLAALEVDRNPEKYFGPIHRESEARFQEVTVPGYVSMASLEHALKIDREKLRELNPALLRSVWEGRLRVPRAYRLRLPEGGEHWTSELLAQRLTPHELYAGQPAPPHYRVQRGDTLVSVAERYGVPVEALARLNRVRTNAPLRAGVTLTLPPGAAATASAAAAAPPAAAAVAAGSAAAAPASAVASAAPGGAVPAEEARRESAEEAEALATVTVTASREPVSAAQAEALSPALGPGAETQQSADPVDYNVARDGTIAVAAEETLGHYADWLGVSAQHLRTLNHMSFRRPVLIGHRIRLDFARVSREEFEQRRKTYHRELQAAYFAAHRIIGSEIYVARPGDSLWTVTQHAAQTPLWLLQQYNPDLDFSDLRAGTQIVLPRVEVVSGGG